MKKYIFISILVLAALNVNAQGVKMKIANKLFSRYCYADASRHYEQMLGTAKYKKYDEDIRRQLAICYDKMGKSENAEKYYHSLIMAGSNKPEDILGYAKNLAKNQKYAEARVMFKKLASVLPKDLRGSSFSTAYDRMAAFFADSSFYRINKVDFNSTDDDLSASFYKNGLLFSSNRYKWRIQKLIFPWNNTRYLDLYYYDPESKKVKSFSSKVNTKYHDGPAAYSEKLSKLIFTRNNYNKARFGKSSDGANNLKLYTANVENDKWTNVSEVPFNNKDYSTGHATFSLDNTKVYFASDMPGGIGGTDIYVVNYDGTNWGTPVNLGPEVNTPGNEMFPWVDGDENLYYSSDGLPGLGGMDIFVTRFVNGKFKKPRNLGYPVNSSMDDFSLTFNSVTGEGYFTSNRGTTDDDNIYKFTKQKAKTICLFAVDEVTKKPIPGVDIKYVTSEGVNDSLNTGDSCVVQDFKVNLTSDYTFTATKTRYEKAIGELPSKELLNLDTVIIVMAPIHIKFQAFVENALTNQPVEGADVVLTNKTTGTFVSGKTNEQGLLELPLDLDMNYMATVDVQGRKCLINKEEFTTLGLLSSQTIYKKFRMICEGDFRISNIYYDFDKFNIRPDAAIELDKLISVMNEFPKITFELSSHTDCRGKDSYNLRLSQKRALEAVKYLVNRGIDQKRLVAKGYGEKMLVNGCSNGVKCTEPEHQLNRRTEFKILKLE